MDVNASFFVAEQSGFMGAAIRRELEKRGYTSFCGEPGNEPDLRSMDSMDRFFEKNKPEYVFLAAGQSYGIQGNINFPATLILDNLLVESATIHNAYKHGVKKLLYMASNCSYPKHCNQPMKPEYLMTGLLEPTNEAYAVAKLAGMKMVQAYRAEYGADFICSIPANTFGPGDDFDPENSHVVGALFNKFHQAKIENSPEVEIWGTGTPRREFMYVDDLASSAVHAMQNYSGAEPINLGIGQDYSITELAELICEVVGYKGLLKYNKTKADGMPRKQLDSSVLHSLGWKQGWQLREALEKSYIWFKENQTTL